MNENKGSKFERNTNLLVDDKKLYMSDSKNFSDKLLDLINIFKKLAGHTINSYKLIVALYSLNKWSKK